MSVAVIAELGVNTNGSYPRAIQMIEAAAQAGCTGVKAQSYRVEDFLEEGHPDWDMFHEWEIWPWLPQLADLAHKHGLLFGTTPTSLEGVEEAVDAGCDFLKNGSDFLPRTDLVQAMLDTGLPTWVSTGMATPEEIHQVPRDAKLMLCTSLYPCPDEEAHLARLVNPRYQGFSDHTQGIEAATIAAYVLTAHPAYDQTMIEKHFTLNKTFTGADHAFSADPHEMAALVRSVRRAETLRGHPKMGMSPAEAENRARWQVREGALRPA